MLLLWKLNAADLLCVVVTQLWCTLLSCLIFIFLLVVALIFLLFLVLSSRECGLKGYQPAYFKRKNKKNWGSFSKEEKPKQKERYSGHHHVG